MLEHSMYEKIRDTAIVYASLVIAASYISREVDS
jgi:hypothetical protein